MSDLTAKFTALEEQLAAQALVTDGYIDTIEAKLQEVLNNMDVMIVNNAANTRALLQALGQSDPCIDCETGTIITPPVITTPVVVDTDRCKRVQAFLDIMQSIVTTVDAVSSVGFPWRPSLVTRTIGEVFAAHPAWGSPPLASIPEYVTITGDLITYALLNAVEGSTLVTRFATIVPTLISSMYLALDPAAAQAAYNSVVDGAEFGSRAGEVFKDVAYSELWSYVFASDTGIDLDAYDGEACGFGLPGITTCSMFISIPAHIFSDDFQAVILPPAFTEFGFIAGDFFGWKFRTTGTPNDPTICISYYDPSNGVHTGNCFAHSEEFYELGAHTNAIAIVTVLTDDAALEFTVEICPPDE